MVGSGGDGQDWFAANRSAGFVQPGDGDPRRRIYRACPGRAVVEVTDLAGVVVDALAYEEAQARRVCGLQRILCAATAGSSSVLALPADGVGRAEAHGPKGGAMIPADICGETHAPGSPGPDGDDGDVPEFSGQLPFAIDSVRVNCDGTKASVLFAHRGHHSVLSTLAVYDVDTDGYRTFDFAITGRRPSRTRGTRRPASSPRKPRLTKTHSPTPTKRPKTFRPKTKVTRGIPHPHPRPARTRPRPVTGGAPRR